MALFSSSKFLSCVLILKNKFSSPRRPIFTMAKNMRAVLKKIHWLGLGLLLLNCSIQSGLVKPQSSLAVLEKEIACLLSDPNLQNATIGLYIESINDNKVIFRQNEHRLFTPASNMKLYTTAASLTKLGPKWKFTTPVYADGLISDSTLTGDLIIQGHGDPAISGRFYQNDPLAIFRSWADSLKLKGIRKIEGDLLADDSFFSGNRLGEGWQWDDEPYYYSAQTSALSFNDNCIDISVTPGRQIDEPALTSVSPLTDYVYLLNYSRTVPADSATTISFDRRRSLNIIEVNGNIAIRADTLTESITIESPAIYFITVLHQTLKSRGIAISGKARVLLRSEKPDYSRMKPLFAHHSPPLSELIKVINKPSHNFYAEQLFKTLGAKLSNHGSFEGGAKAIGAWLISIGLSPNEYSIVDGSGLSRLNLVSPFSTATLLRYMYRHKHFDYYYQSLPIAGVDGTLKNRMLKTSAQNNVHAKTGFVRYTRSLSGFISDATQRPYVFVMMFNHFTVPVSYINDLQDKICVILSNYLP